jgi:hypothetical protein
MRGVSRSEGSCTMGVGAATVASGYALLKKAGVKLPTPAKK